MGDDIVQPYSKVAGFDLLDNPPSDGDGGSPLSDNDPWNISSTAVRKRTERVAEIAARRERHPKAGRSYSKADLEGKGRRHYHRG